MSERNRNPLVRTIGVLALLVVLVAVSMMLVELGYQKPRDDLGFRNRGTALQFVVDASGISKILGPDASVNRPILRKVILIDFAFILGYVSLFIAISVLLFRRNCPWARYLALMALVTGVTAAAFDVRENIAMLKVLDCFPCDPGPFLINTINDSALAKWCTSFVTIGLLAIAFQDLPSNLARWISITFTLTALLGLVGLWRHSLLFLSFGPQLAGLGLLAFTAFVHPKKLTEGSC
jgi:hypothetical protein